MRHERYLTPEGRVLYRAETNKHHLMYEGQQYCGRFERNDFREMGGFIIRMAVTVHNDLHANVEPPIKPCNNLMRAMVQHNKLLEPMASAYEKFQDMTMYLGYLSSFAQSQQIREESALLHENFREQAVFINNGMVEYNGTR